MVSEKQVSVFIGVVVLGGSLALTIVDPFGIGEDLDDEFETHLNPQKITLVEGVNTDQTKRTEIVDTDIIEYKPFGLTKYDNDCYIKYRDGNGTVKESYIVHPRAVDTDHGHLIIYL